MDTDRNLLFGVLALQADLIDHDQFTRACVLWSAQKGRPLADILIEQSWLSPSDRVDVEKLLVRKLHKHHGDVKASLREATTDDVRQSLAGVADPEIHGTLAAATPPEAGPVLLSTTAFVPEVRAHYTLSRLHATGGIGRVWLARDGSLGRDVALKELRPERADQPAVWQRFLKEAQITGQLEHPGIVPIYELGQKPDGRSPFYTMRFVRGRTLAEAASAYHGRRQRGEAGPLEFRELLAAFVGVCNAVAYAHSRGVLHRDLKPQNVILGDYGEVMVLDWGLAKVAGEPESDAAPPLSVQEPADQTQAGQVLGTPGYLSPEQADGRLDLLDARTDVYGLGAILYQLLAGRSPFSGTDTEAVLQQVRREPPVPPRRLVPSCPRALEAVCLKALAKDRSARYGSVRELASDVQHYLADEPVAAYREPVAVRLARWGRRHRALVTGAAALLVTAVVGLTIGAVLLGQANARIEREHEEMQAQRDRADENFQTAQAQRDRADANFQKAQKAVDDYLTQVSENTLLKSPLPGLQPLRKQLLQAALTYYESFAAEHREDPALQAELARVHARAGEIAVDLGSEAEGSRSLRAARDLLEKLAREQPEQPGLRAELAHVYLQLARGETRKPEDAAERLRRLQRAHELAAELVGQDGQNMAHQALLARSYGKLAQWHTYNGKPAEELPLLKKAAELWAELAGRDRKYRADAASATMNLGYYHTRVGDADAGQRFHEQARDQFAALVQEEPADVTLLSELRRAYTNLGYLQQSLRGRYDLALVHYAKARLVIEQLTRDHPAVSLYQLQRIGNLNQAAAAFIQLGQAPRAEPLLREALAIVERLQKQNPDSVQLLYDTGEVHINRGRVHLAQRKPREAVEEFKQAVQWQGKAHEANPDDLDNRMGYARTLRLLGVSQRQIGELEAAEESLLKAVRLCEEVAPETRQRSHLLLANLVVAYGELSTIAEAAVKPTAAGRYHEQMVRVWEKELSPIQRSTSTVNYVQRAHQRRARWLLKDGQPAAAAAELRQAEQLLEGVAVPSVADLLDLGRVRAMLSTAVGAEEGEKYADGAMAALKEHIAKGGRPLSATLLKNADFEALRGRAEFQALVGTLQQQEKALLEEQQHALRAKKLLAVGDHAGAVKSVEAMLASKARGPLTDYNAACYYSLASALARKDPALAAAEQEKLAGQYADRAVELLQQAVTKGYNTPANIDHLRKDADLNPLRGRPDFQKLLAQWEKGAAADGQ
jgi:serine/threonine-protein kinase